MLCCGGKHPNTALVGDSHVTLGEQFANLRQPNRYTPMNDLNRRPLAPRADPQISTFNRAVDAQNPGGEFCAPTAKREGPCCPKPGGRILDSTAFPEKLAETQPSLTHQKPGGRILAS